ncbi:MAG TPA: diphthine synthase [Pyrodictium sp.]|nr:diphthine synthase [Pyrodictium sp.]
MLYLVGFGPSARFLSIAALQALACADKVYVDTYTSFAEGLDLKLVKLLAPRAEVVKASRKHLEDLSHKIVDEAKHANIVVLVAGDPLTATTHNALRLEALKQGVKVEVIPAVSGLQLVIAVTGLSWYRFGRPITLVFPEEHYKPYSTVEVVVDNLERGLHTLVLLDFRVDQGKIMDVKTGAKLLFELAEEMGESFSKRLREAVMVGVARAGFSDQKCVAGRLEDILASEFPPPPHTLIVAHPRLHPVEEDLLKHLCGFKKSNY